MKEKQYTVVIPTSGIGEDLGSLVKYTNKTLLKVGEKPALSYIIAAYPQNTTFVITLGHFADHIKEYISLAHPDIKVKYVLVDNYQGKDSSLGYSLLQAKKYLKKPFIYHASDTIVLEKIPTPNTNWIAGYKGKASSQYHSFRVMGNKVQFIDEKGAINSEYLHIGLVGINETTKFWESLESLYKKTKKTSDVEVINHMINAGSSFSPVPFSSWFDVGNTEGLNDARAKINDSFHILDKPTESIFLFNSFVIKFFSDKDLVKNRVERTKYLNGLTPKILESKKNFYKYEYSKGELLADIATPKEFAKFLCWSAKNLWQESHEVSENDFKARCLDFYKTKTEKRIKEFLSSRNVVDVECRINDEIIPKIDEILERIDFEWLSSSQQTHFHGDYILDNILKSGSGYTLLDWRQDFGGLLESGDMYYDLAKLNHNLTINHGIINQGLFTIEKDNGTVTCNVLRKNSHVLCQQELFTFAKAQEYDSKKIRVLTALIWLNMSPLHEYPFDNFLYYFGKYNLWRTLNE